MILAELGLFHWVSQNMPIDLYCEDVEPHPVNNVSLFYRIWDDTSKSWSSWVETNGEGQVHAQIFFTEDSVHKVQYYCVDVLGNSIGTATDPYEQAYRVDTLAPTITDYIFTGPYYGECDDLYANPNEYKGHDCFVDSQTSLDILTKDNGNICHVDGVQCRWRYRIWSQLPTYEMQDIPSWTEWNSTFPITFPEESYHEIQIKCNDSLGNEMQETIWLTMLVHTLQKMARNGLIQKLR